MAANLVDDGCDLGDIGAVIGDREINARDLHYHGGSGEYIDSEAEEAALRKRLGL